MGLLEYKWRLVVLNEYKCSGQDVLIISLQTTTGYMQSDQLEKVATFGT